MFFNSLYLFFLSRDGKARKSVTYNYACMLTLLVMQNSTELKMMEHFVAPLLIICKADENNVKLRGEFGLVLNLRVKLNMKWMWICDLRVCISELSKWLEPLDKLHFDISGIPTLIDYIKQVSHSAQWNVSQGALLLLAEHPFLSFLDLTMTQITRWDIRGENGVI